jgi:hypothetical protein
MLFQMITKKGYTVFVSYHILLNIIQKKLIIFMINLIVSDLIIVMSRDDFLKRFLNLKI